MQCGTLRCFWQGCCFCSGSLVLPRPPPLPVLAMPTPGSSEARFRACPGIPGPRRTSPAGPIHRCRRALGSRRTGRLPGQSNDSSGLSGGLPAGDAECPGRADLAVAPPLSTVGGLEFGTLGGYLEQRSLRVRCFDGPDALPLIDHPALLDAAFRIGRAACLEFPSWRPSRTAIRSSGARGFIVECTPYDGYFTLRGARMCSTTYQAEPGLTIHWDVRDTTVTPAQLAKFDLAIRAFVASGRRQTSTSRRDWPCYSAAAASSAARRALSPAPLAAGSRSTNSTIAIGAMSP